MSEPLRPPATPSEMLAHADMLEADAAKLEATAAAQRRDAGVWREMARRLRDSSRLPLDADNATIQQPMQSEKTQSATKPRRPGRKFGGGPFAIASKNSGKSMTEIAVDLDANLGTVKAWNALHRNPPGHIREKLAKKPYSVPSSAWKQ